MLPTTLCSQGRKQRAGLRPAVTHPWEFLEYRPSRANHGALPPMLPPGGLMKSQGPPALALLSVDALPGGTRPAVTILSATCALSQGRLRPALSGPDNTEQYRRGSWVGRQDTWVLGLSLCLLKLFSSLFCCVCWSHLCCKVQRCPIRPPSVITHLRRGTFWLTSMKIPIVM